MVIYVTDAIRIIMDYGCRRPGVILVSTIEDVIVDISLKASAVVECGYDQ
jgi:hypothetical protein